MAISDSDKLVIDAIGRANTIAELYAFQVDGRSKAVDDAINRRGTALMAEGEKTMKGQDGEEDHEGPLTITSPYAFYDDDNHLHSWQPGEKLSPEDTTTLEERGVKLVSWVTYEG